MSPGPWDTWLSQPCALSHAPPRGPGEASSASRSGGLRSSRDTVSSGAAPWGPVPAHFGWGTAVQGHLHHST